MRLERCEFCDGIVKKTTTVIRFNYKRNTIYIENVPVRVCRGCGEIYYEAEVYKRLERIAQNRGKIRTKITFPLPDYGMAEAS